MSHEHTWQVTCSSCGEVAPPGEDDQDHYVVFGDDHWVVSHSLACRVSGHLLDCRMTREVESMAVEMKGQGRFKMTQYPDAFNLERADPSGYSS